MDKAILRKWLKAGFMEKHVLHPTEAGRRKAARSPRCSANLTLDGLEALLRERFPQTHAEEHDAR